MNFLAHLYLSGNDEGLLVGNFIADAVKGRKPILTYPQEVQRGIIMHREIDHFMDTHPVVKQGMGRLRDGYPKFSGVIMDMFYDHLLAARWEQYHPDPLKDFSHSVFNVLDQHQEIFPDRMQMMYPYFRNQNWMLSYDTVEGIGEVLGRMARRINRGVPLNKATNELRQHYEDYGTEFEKYFDEIMDYMSERYKISLPNRK